MMIRSFDTWTNTTACILAIGCLSAPANALAPQVSLNGFIELIEDSPEFDFTFHRDHFGSGVSWLGDVDGDGFDELAVGASRFDQDPNVADDDVGALYVLGIDHDAFGKVRASVKNRIPATSLLQMPVGEEFGLAVASLGDLDGCPPHLPIPVGAPGVSEVAVGTAADRVHVLFLDRTGAVAANTMLSGSAGSGYGRSVAGLNDLDGDGFRDLAVGAPLENNGRGAVYLEFLDATANSLVTIAIQGPTTPSNTRFGSSVACLGDVDGNGMSDLAVGAPGPQNGNVRGEVYVLYLAPTGNPLSPVTVLSTNPVSANGFTGSITDDERFGAGLAAAFDVNSALNATGQGTQFTWDTDPHPELVIGSPGYQPPSGAPFQQDGRFWVLYLRAPTPTQPLVQGQQAFDGLSYTSNNEDFFREQRFGSSLCFFRAFDSDSYDLCIGAPFHDENEPETGEVFMTGMSGLVSYEPGFVASRNSTGTCTGPVQTPLCECPNPESYLSERPVVGRPWKASVDLTTTGHASATIVAFFSATEFELGGGQCLLTLDDGLGEQFAAPFVSGPQAEFCLPVPNDPTLFGLTFYTQALHAFGVAPFALSNAIDLTFGSY